MEGKHKKMENFERVGIICQRNQNIHILLTFDTING